jgi:hypothetical protein
MITEHLLQSDGNSIYLGLDESTGNFVVACTPEPTKGQQAQLQPYLHQWARQIARGWAKRSGHRSATVDFTKKISGNMRKRERKTQ